jgi:olefin beta-lactone synthetase
MTIGDIFAEQVRIRPEALAIVDAWGGGERRLSYAALEREVAVAGSWLRAQGLREGKAVLVFVPMSADLYIALLAMFRLGIVALFLDPSAGRTHIEQCCARWAPDALLAIPKAHWLRATSRALRRIRLKISMGGWALGARRWLHDVDEKAAGASWPEIHHDHPALVTFTSGSTGVPKAAVRTHGFLAVQHRVLAPSIALEPGEVDLATLPIFTLANLASGVTTVIPDFDLQRPGAVDGARVAAHIDRFGISRITASPAFFERVVASARSTGRTLPTLRKLYTGGAPVFPRLLAALREIAPHARVVSVYGSTEAEPIAHVDAGEVSPEDFAAMQRGRGLLTGAPVLQIQLRIIRDRSGTPCGKFTSRELASDTLPSGAAGEIVVTGSHVLRGYLGGVGEEETKFSVDDAIWHRTGDAGLLDERGRLWLLGRCAARIDDAHGQLYPFSVECVAMTFPAVRRAAVIAHRDVRWLIVEASGDRDGLESPLREATAWAHIGGVRFVDTMPVDRRHNAKIDYPALKRALNFE